MSVLHDTVKEVYNVVRESENGYFTYSDLEGISDYINYSDLSGLFEACYNSNIFNKKIIDHKDDSIIDVKHPYHSCTSTQEFIIVPKG